MLGHCGAAFGLPTILPRSPTMVSYPFLLLYKVVSEGLHGG